MKKSRILIAVLILETVVLLAVVAAFLIGRARNNKESAEQPPSFSEPSEPVSEPVDEPPAEPPAEPSDAETTPDETPAETPPEEAAPSMGYSVSTSCDLATDVGMAVLEAGGNAVDAAVAVSYALAVTEPYASGLGGSGGLLLYDQKTGECVFYDYRACAGSVKSSDDKIGVPGFVAGLEAVYLDYGTVPFAELIQPAIDFAEDGFPVSAQMSDRISGEKAILTDCGFLHKEDGSLLTQGDTLRQTQLAQVLREVQTGGAQAFYHGWIAADIAENTSLTEDDLAAYRVYKRDAVQGSFEGYTVYGANAPLSGVTLIQMLELAELIDIADPIASPDSYLADLQQITALAYGIRTTTICDPDFAQIDEQSLVSPSFIRNLLGSNYDQEDYDSDYESPETTSFTIIDSDGLVVSATNTLTHYWGTGIAVDGIFMNNTNSNFSSSGLNKYKPGKRSRTFTAPTIIVGEDGSVMAIGTPGGNNIPSRLFCVLLDILKFGMDPQEAVLKPAIMYRNGTLTMEVGVDSWFDVSAAEEPIDWKSDGAWWGSVSVSGYSEEAGTYAAYDPRRGATKVGVYNP